MADDGKTKDSAPDYVAHRQRLRERFLRDDGESFADYELLEFLLCHAIPRRDVKPLAKTLIKTFGSFAATVAADPAALRSVEGVGDATVAALKLTRAGALRLSLAQAMQRDVVSSWQALLDYCRTSIAFAAVE